MKAQACQNLNVPAGTNSIAAGNSTPKLPRRTSLDARFPPLELVVGFSNQVDSMPSLTNRDQFVAARFYHFKPAKNFLV
jgi:hypothetical protein